jgi:hypothetical protein
LPQLPQLALSVFTSAQYEDAGPPSEVAPPSGGAHFVCDGRHAEPHFPAAQTSSTLQALPHVPQLALSVPVFAQ